MSMREARDGEREAGREREPEVDRPGDGGAGPGRPGGGRTVDDGPGAEDAGDERTREEGRGGSGRPGWSDTLGGTFSDVQELVGEVLEGVRESVPAALGRFPRLDLVRLGDEGYRVRMDLPGVERPDVRVRTRGGELVVEGERRRPELPAGAETIRSERGFGRFRRTLRMPPDVEESGVTASLEDGVLEVLLPRVVETPSREIEID